MIQKAKYPSQCKDRFNLRVPADVHRRITFRAAEDNRAINTYINQYLHIAVTGGEDVSTPVMIDRLVARLMVLRNRLIDRDKPAVNPPEPADGRTATLVLRFDDGLKSQVTEAAKLSKKSLNQYIVDVLVSTLRHQDSIEDLRNEFDILMNQLNQKGLLS